MIYYKTYDFNPENPVSKSEKIIEKQLRDYVLERSLELATGKKFHNFEVSYNKYGKPTVNSDIHFSISHTRGFVCCAVCDVEVGVDAEYIRPVNTALINKICNTEEKQALLSGRNGYSEFFKYWTLKESYIKMIGMGLSFPMNKINFTFHNNNIVSNAENASFDATIINGVAVALCQNKSKCKINFEKLQ